ERHFDFAGYIPGFDPRALGERAELGYGDEPLCVVSVGGSGVGAPLLQRALEALPAARERIPELRVLVVTGPRIDPARQPASARANCSSIVGWRRFRSSCSADFTPRLNSSPTASDAPAARMRESGTTGPGVAEVMQAAGLTHGGFYKHFGSRDDLVAEAVGKAFADANAGFDALTDGAEDPLAAFVDWYASAAHCEDPATGCAVVALGADVARGDDRVRA